MSEKPTIAELDKILGQPNAEFEISPDGSLVGSEFRKELESLLNRHSKENGSDTPDFVLADFLIRSLAAFDAATTRRSEWYSPAATAAVPGERGNG